MNILLVDDDKLFVRKTIEGIDWDEIGVRAIYSAYNMEKALQILDVFSIDIMITDMEMPNGNGLELLEIVSQKYKAMDTLVISGYAHFSYAQKSMEYGVKRFLVKPVSNKELRKILEEIIADRKRMKQISEHAEPVSSEIFTDIKDSKEAGYELEKMVLSCPKDKYFHEVEFRIMYEEKKNMTEKKLLVCLVNSVIVGFFDESAFTLAGLMRVDERKWRMYIQKNHAEESVDGILGKIQSYLDDMLQLKTCFYVGSVGKIEAVAENHDRFTELCDHMLFFDQAMLFQEKMEKNLQVPMKSGLDFEQLDMEIDQGNVADARNRIVAYLKELYQEQYAALVIFENLLKEIDKTTLSSIAKRKIEFEKFFDKEEYQSYYDHALQSLSEMYKFVNYIMEHLEKMIGSENGKRQIVDKLKDYIGEHLNEELSRAQLANSVNFSGDYVARIFKVVTGRTISEYVMEQRIEKAKEYLLETDMSVGDISYEVGFNNFSYFSKAFKEHTGNTPNEYRTKKTT